MFTTDLALNVNMCVKNTIRSEGTVDDYEYPISLWASVFKSWVDLKLKCELEWPYSVWFTIVTIRLGYSQLRKV